MAHPEENIRTIARIGVNESGNIVVKYWIGDRVGEVPEIIGKKFDLIIRELKPGMYAYSIDRKP